MEEPFRRELAQGERLFSAGDIGGEAYIVEWGQIEILHEHSDGAEVIARLGTDALFGDMALLGNGTRSASAVASIASRVMVIPRERFTKACDEADPLLRHVLRLSIDRVDSMLRGNATLGDAATRKLDRADQHHAWGRLRLQEAMETALANGEFELAYQPLVRLQSAAIAAAGGSEISGFEALLRWPGPKVTVSPAEFIPIAEASGLIIPIGYWIINTACAAAAQLSEAAGTIITVAINLSVSQLNDPGLFPCIEAALDRHQLPPGALKLEITESLLMSDFDTTQRLLNWCQAMNIPLAIDDFGSGYSSLAYLHQMPAHTIKLDRGFIVRITENQAAKKIVGAITQMARALGMHTVAEGIETEEQAAIVRELGVADAQGFLFYRPAPLSKALSLVRGDAHRGKNGVGL